MPTTNLLPIKQLKLDLKNFRTIPQKNEISAVHAMIAINPDWFWALMESLLTDGYHPTENILVLKDGSKLIVKEGNRRIAALKLIYGLIKLDDSILPSHVVEKIVNVAKDWKSANKQVPCAIYESNEIELVDKVVTITHGKGEKAGRDAWKSVARARHNRDMNGASEPGLDILEKFLKESKNVNDQQRERWSGDYPLTVLDEAVKKLAPRFGVTSSRELADQYPKKIKYRNELDNILRDIGLDVLGFKKLRNEAIDFADTYGIPILVKSGGANASTNTGASTNSTTSATGSASGAGVGGATSASGRKAKAVATDDPKAVMRALKAFIPRGKNREKLVTLLNETKRLTLSKHPHAFCFLLRSMFEISAKAYCLDHHASGGPTHTKSAGEDRALVDVLRDVSSHLTKNNKDKAMTKALHGAMTELGKKEGLLSVTSLNQLVHHPKFTVDETHISTVFGNIFPLLEEMNS